MKKEGVVNQWFNFEIQSILEKVRKKQCQGFDEKTARRCFSILNFLEC
jgi:hypothetical protein